MRTEVEPKMLTTVLHCMLATSIHRYGHYKYWPPIEMRWIISMCLSLLWPEAIFEMFEQLMLLLMLVSTMPFSFSVYFYVQPSISILNSFSSALLTIAHPTENLCRIFCYRQWTFWVRLIGVFLCTVGKRAINNTYILFDVWNTSNAFKSLRWLDQNIEK